VTEEESKWRGGMSKNPEKARIGGESLLRSRPTSLKFGGGKRLISYLKRRVSLSGKKGELQMAYGEVDTHGVVGG